MAQGAYHPQLIKHYLRHHKQVGCNTTQFRMAAFPKKSPLIIDDTYKDHLPSCGHFKQTRPVTGSGIKDSLCRTLQLCAPRKAVISHIRALSRLPSGMATSASSTLVSEPPPDWCHSINGSERFPLASHSDSWVKDGHNQHDTSSAHCDSAFSSCPSFFAHAYKHGKRFLVSCPSPCMLHCVLCAVLFI